MNLAERELRAFAIEVILIGGLRRKRRDRIEDVRRGAEHGRIFADALLPRLAVHANINARADEGVRLFVRKIRRVAFGSLRRHLLASLDFDQGFGGGAVLTVGLAPDFAAQDVRIIVNRCGRARACPVRRAIADAVRVVELVAADARLNLEPSAAILVAREQCAIRARHGSKLAIGNGNREKISGRISFTEGRY